MITKLNFVCLVFVTHCFYRTFVHIGRKRRWKEHDSMKRHIFCFGLVVHQNGRTPENIGLDYRVGESLPENHDTLFYDTMEAVLPPIVNRHTHTIPQTTYTYADMTSITRKSVPGEIKLRNDCISRRKVVSIVWRNSVSWKDHIFICF